MWFVQFSMDHSILSYKMDARGLHGKLKDWIQSYLVDRKQFVVVWEKIWPSNTALWCPTGIPLGTKAISDLSK